MSKTNSIYLGAYTLLLMVDVYVAADWKYANVDRCAPEVTQSQNGKFIWEIKHPHMDYVVSQPDICWQNNSIVVRHCAKKDGSKIWQPEVVESCEKLEKNNYKCPEDLTEVFVNGQPICLKLSKDPQPYRDSYCYGSNYILNGNDHVLMAALLQRNIERLWLPIRRVKKEKFKPFVIRLPGPRWHKVYPMAFENHTILAQQHCVSARLQRGNPHPTIQIETVDCSEPLHAVCIYRGKLVARNGCPQNFGALSYRPQECYGVTWDGEKYPEDLRLLTVQEFYEKINILKLIFDEHKIRTNGDVEVAGIPAIANGKWTINIKTNRLSIRPMDSSLRSLCVEHVPNRKNVELVLRLDPDHDTLILTVYNKFYIWSDNDDDGDDYGIHCFMNAGYGQQLEIDLDEIWENELQTKTMFELEIDNDYPSEYWCEAHTIFNFTLVSSKRIVVGGKKRVHNFAIHYDIPLRTEDVKLYNEPLPKISKAYAKKIEKELKIQRKINNLHELSIQNVRLMDIVELYRESGRLKCLCHLSVSLKLSAFGFSSSEESSEEYIRENDNSTRRYVFARMLARDLLEELMKKTQPQHMESVRSTKYCFPESEWPLALIGQMATTSSFCLKGDGLPLARKCLGNFLRGAYWDDTIPENISNCITPKEEHSITKDLFEMYSLKVPQKNPHEAVHHVRKLLESNLEEIIPADVHYMAKIVRKSIRSLFKSSSSSFSTQGMSHTNNTSTMQWTSEQQNLFDVIIEILRIFNYLMNAKDEVLYSARVLNATNVLLDTFEYLMDETSLSAFRQDSWLDQHRGGNFSYTEQDQDPDQISKGSESEKKITVMDYKDVGVVVQIAANFLIFSINPNIANITGVALFHSDTDSGEEVVNDVVLHGAFEHEYFRFIMANASAQELLNNDLIVVGTFVPTSLWQRLDEISNVSPRNVSAPRKNRPQPSVVIKIYANDNFFQEDKATSETSVVGKVISVSIPGHDKDLPELLPLILTANKGADEDVDIYCSYWNYQTWADDGIMLLERSELDNKTILCGCSHLTPFAYLVRGTDNLSVDSEVEVIVTRIHEKALDIITFLGCSLSLFGIVGIFTTACIFRSWRQKANSKVLLQLSAAIALQMILFCFVNTNEYSHHLIVNEIYSKCIAIGALLHYSVLVQFCWMGIIAYLQFKRYVTVFGNARPKRFFIKSALVGWVLPLVPVASVLMLDKDSYIPDTNVSNNPICYPSGKSLYIGIVLPIALVILANLIIFVVVIWNIVRNPTGSVRHAHDKSLAISQIRLLVLLFFLLGFTWIFGLMTAMNAGLVFSYLFCLTATLQGFVLFIYFIVMDPITRRMWYGNLRVWFHFKSNAENACNTKDTTQQSSE